MSLRSLKSLRSLESLACPFVPRAPPMGCMGNMGGMGGMGSMGRRRGPLTTHHSPTRRPAASAPGAVTRPFCAKATWSCKRGASRGGSRVRSPSPQNPQNRLKKKGGRTVPVPPAPPFSLMRLILRKKAINSRHTHAMLGIAEHFSCKALIQKEN